MNADIDAGGLPVLPPEEFMLRFAPALFPTDKLSTLEWCELQAWRRIGGRLQLAVEDLLARQGDAATHETISLQHGLVELRRAPFGGLPLTAIEQSFP